MSSRKVMLGISPKQISKLRNGHRVRVRPPMEGEGVCVIVKPETYDLVSRTFGRGRGLEMSLSPEELQANKAEASSMEGRGIFGPAFDRFLERKGMKKAVYKIADQLKPAAKTALIGALTAGGASLATANPALIPYIPGGVAALSSLGLDYLENPNSYYSGAKTRKAKSLAGRMAEDKALQIINRETGANLGALDRASIGSAIANKAQAEMIDRSVADQYSFSGMGLYAGQGLGYGVGRSGCGVGGERGVRRTGGSIGLGGGMVSQPPALRSQPFSANFQFQHTLPPSYQKFSKGSGLGL